MPFETAPDEEAHQAVLTGLGEFNHLALRGAAHVPLRAFLRDDGEVVAGALDWTLEKWAFIDVIWVAPDQRRGGIGAALLHEMELQAQAHDCEAIFLDTFAYQALDFYLKHGFEVATELPNVGAFTRYFLRKTLT